MLWIARSVWRARVSSCGSNSTSPKTQSSPRPSQQLPASKPASQQASKPATGQPAALGRALCLDQPSHNVPGAHLLWGGRADISPLRACRRLFTPLCNLPSLPLLHPSVTSSCPQVVAARTTIRLHRPPPAYSPKQASKQAQASKRQCPVVPT